MEVDMKARLYVVAALFGAVLVLTGLSTTVSEASPHYRDGIVIRHTLPPKLDIPRGHLPPVGSYRLWFPGRAPGHQPAPTRRVDIIRYAPPGAWRIYRPAYDRRFVYVQVIDARFRGVVREVHVFDARRGTYVRTERPVRVRYRR